MKTPRGMKEVIATFGDNKTVELSKGNCKGDPTWEHENLIVLRNVCGTGQSIQIHHSLADLFKSCLTEARSRCPNYAVRMLGGYCARHQRNDPSLPLSIHSYGAAFDVNWDKNPMGKKLVTDIPPAFIAAFVENGWEWGGNWSSIKDAMHFQFATGV